MTTQERRDEASAESGHAAPACGICHWCHDGMCIFFEHCPAAPAPFWAGRSVVAKVGEDEGRDCPTWEPRL